MFEIKIYNMRFTKPTHEWDFRVDRQSPVGNPFYMNDENQRDIVCDKYESYFQKIFTDYAGSFGTVRQTFSILLVCSEALSR